MRTTQKVILVLLIIGLLLSSIIRIRFNLSNGFEYHGFWIRLLPLPIFDYAEHGSNEIKLTSTILGYLFFLFAGLMMIIFHKSNIIWVFVFIAITSVSIYFESTSIIQDLNSKFIGQHLRVGPFLFIVGIILFYEDKIRLKLKRNG